MNLNSAPLHELQELHGVGSVTARLIIASRPFSSVKDLLCVKGIGPIKLAAIIAHNQVYVDEEDPPCSTTAKANTDSSTIDLNAASSRQLQQLKGVGPVLAQRILKARPFHRKEELLAVKGISSKSYVKIQAGVHVSLTDFDSLQHKGYDCKNGEDVKPKLEQNFRFCREIESDVRQSVFPIPSHDNSDDRALIVASWNIRNISRQKSTFLLQRIADVLCEFDLVALQEVRDLIVLKRLKTMLLGWDYVVSDPVGRKSPGKKTRAERYAFFFRRCVVRLVDKCLLMEDRNNVLTRLPCVATFQATKEAGVSNLKLALMNVHVSFGKKEHRHDEIVEINRLANEISTSAPNGRKVVVLGDFNLSPQDVLGTLGSQKMALIRAPLSTTVFGKLYDNIWLDRDDFGRQNAFDGKIKYHMDSGVLRVDWRYYPCSKSSRVSIQNPMDTMVPRLQTHMSRVQCGYELSDHCPVWVAFVASKRKQCCD
ncbi:unnamed protein product [Peronospora belbahrii]|uniref:Endonuclease/exonuclease/phosphatase family domain-containing protein 1 n=1 Tax=Peronospora belbahrii TaxID=622444 RepID=A0AAU9LBJ1_9STRA|nr:unnamed protein product [Peronospora belbahrii]CAH0519134.1 unnamed protein product [Peronospora belbahrii]